MASGGLRPSLDFGRWCERCSGWQDATVMIAAGAILLLFKSVRPLPFVWPYALVFWAVYLWAFAPEWKIVAGGMKGVKRSESQDNGSLQLILGGVWIARLPRKVIDQLVKPLLMERKHMIRRVPPDAPELSRPIEIN